MFKSLWKRFIMFTYLEMYVTQRFYAIGECSYEVQAKGGLKKSFWICSFFILTLNNIFCWWSWTVAWNPQWGWSLLASIQKKEKTVHDNRRQGMDLKRNSYTLPSGLPLPWLGFNLPRAQTGCFSFKIFEGYSSYTFLCYSTENDSFLLGCCI